MAASDPAPDVATSTAPRRRGRKPRFTSDELERRALDAALDAVLTNGVTAGVDAIRIEKVVIDADIPRAATYALWEGRGSGTPQENLRRAVVLEIVRTMPAGNASTTGEHAFELIAANADVLECGDRDEIRAFRAELIRSVAAHNFALLQGQRWRVYKTLTSSIGTLKDPELRAAVAAGEEALLAAYGALFEQFAEIFGLELRDEFTMSQFSMSAYALNEGLSNRVGKTFVHQTVIRDDADWTVFAVGFEALVNHYFRELP
jgi:hypothetical protein